MKAFFQYLFLKTDVETQGLCNVLL